MESKTSPSFWGCFNSLPDKVQEAAKKKFALWQENAFHPSLHFKCVNQSRALWSVRINQGYRALGVRKPDDTILWFWVGSHDEYERQINH